MRIRLALAAVFILASGASAEDYGRPTAILVSPIHEAQVVRGDDGMDHVEYDLLVVSVFSEPVTLSSVTVLNPAGKELIRIDGDVLAAATQTLFAKTPSPVIPASAAVSVDVDLILPPGAAPERVTHRIAYTLAPDSKDKAMIDRPEVDGPEVAINRQASHRASGRRLRGMAGSSPAAAASPTFTETNASRSTAPASRPPKPSPSTGARSRATDSSTVTARRSSSSMASARTCSRSPMEPWSPFTTACPMQTPFVLMTPKSKSDYGGNNLMLEIAPNVFAWYAHLRQGSIAVKVGDAVKAGAPIAKFGNTGPSRPPSPFRSSRQAGSYRRAEPAFRLRQLHLGRRGRFR